MPQQQNAPRLRRGNGGRCRCQAAKIHGPAAAGAG